MEVVEDNPSTSHEGKISYKNSLLKLQEDVVQMEDFVNEIPENRWYKEDEHLPKPQEKVPVVPLTNEEWESWSEPWKHTLVVKVLGKRVSFRIIESKLQRSWIKGGPITIIDMSEGYFLIKFSSKEDYNHAVFERHWMVADHYLLV